MLIIPAIDLYEGKAVRLYKGDYQQKTIYADNPLEVAFQMKEAGASILHLIDLEGAASGTSPNREIICEIKEKTGLFIETGGGIRNPEIRDYYLDRGIDRVILGSAALTDPAFLEDSLKLYGEKIAVSADIKDEKVAIHGWKETADNDVFTFCDQLQAKGLSTLICTDISKDGAMKGTNLELYTKLRKRYKMNIIASGGVRSLDDVIALKNLDIYGAIIGKAYYTKAIDLKEALEVSL